jgi:CubicO group peptidase (beta-lactamase class C family)
LARVGAALLALAGLAVPAVAQTAAAPTGGLPSAKLAAVEGLLTAEMSRRDIPGLSAAIVLDKELRFAGGYGLSDLENNVPAKAATMYRLASVSKPITAVAVLQLVEKGKIDLEAPVQKYVPAFPEKPWPVTIHQLLAHLGGVRWYRGDEMHSTRHYGSLLESLSIFKDDPLEHEPGTKFLYSTYGYNLLGATVESASGMSYAEYLRQNVFGPAGMEHTQVDDLRALIRNRAQGYERTASGELANSGLADTSNKLPGGGLIGTVEDVARFAIALEGGTLLQKESLAQMMARQAARDGRPTGYGLGLFLADRKNVREAWHTGGQPRVSNVLYMQPDRRLAVVLLTNLEGIAPALVDLARQIADLVGGP